MADPVLPSEPPAPGDLDSATPDPIEPAAPVAEAEPAEPVAKAEPAPLAMLNSLDTRTRMAVVAGLVVAAVGLIGSIVDAWSLQFSGLIMIVAGLGAAGAAYLASTRKSAAPGRLPLRDVILAGGTISAILGILYVVQVVLDLGDLSEDYGGVLGLAAVIVLAVAGVALYIAATRWWTGGPAAPWRTMMRSGDRSTRLILVGTALVVVGWLITVATGFWFLEAGSELLTFMLLAALVVRAAGDPEQPLRLPFPAILVALGLMIIGAIIALQHTSRMIGEGATLDDWFAQAIYVAGVAIAIAGAVLGTLAATRTMRGGSAASTPEA